MPKRNAFGPAIGVTPCGTYSGSLQARCSTSVNPLKTVSNPSQVTTLCLVSSNAREADVDAKYAPAIRILCRLLAPNHLGILIRSLFPYVRAELAQRQRRKRINGSFRLSGAPRGHDTSSGARSGPGVLTGTSGTSSRLRPIPSWNLQPIRRMRLHARLHEPTTSVP